MKDSAVTVINITLSLNVTKAEPNRLSVLFDPSAADLTVPCGVLSVCCFPGHCASVQRHPQLSDWHRHRPVRGACLLLWSLSTRVQTATYHHQTPP